MMPTVDTEAIYKEALEFIADPLLSMAENYSSGDFWMSRSVHLRYTHANAIFSFGDEGTPFQVHMFKDGSFFFNGAVLDSLNDIDGRKGLLLCMLDMLESGDIDGYNTFDLVRLIAYVTKWNGDHLVRGLANNLKYEFCKWEPKIA